MNILRRRLSDEQVLWLLDRIVCSFHSTFYGKGLPLGNLTSQLLVNVYMDEFDRFVKHALRVKYYLRYADDFVIFSQDRNYLKNLIPHFERFLGEKLALKLHPEKVFIRTLASGVDFLGWVHFSDHRVLRTTTKRRMIKRLQENPSQNTAASYVGLLKHGNARKLNAIINFNGTTPR